MKLPKGHIRHGLIDNPDIPEDVRDMVSSTTKAILLESRAWNISQEILDDYIQSALLYNLERFKRNTEPVAKRRTLWFYAYRYHMLGRTYFGGRNEKERLAHLQNVWHTTNNYDLIGNMKSSNYMKEFWELNMITAISDNGMPRKDTIAMYLGGGKLTVDLIAIANRKGTTRAKLNQTINTNRGLRFYLTERPAPDGNRIFFSHGEIAKAFGVSRGSNHIRTAKKYRLTLEPNG